MRRGLVALFWLLCAGQAYATVIKSVTFESYSTAGDACTQILATADISRCIEEVGSDISIVDSIPGFSGSFPSGSKVMRAYADSTSVQTEVGITIGNAGSAAYDNYLPANHWFQFAMYLNATGAEVSVMTNNAAKLWYPARSQDGVNTCTSGNGGCQFILELQKSNSLAPHNDTSLNAGTASAWLLNKGGQPATDANWAGAAPGDENKLGQTTLTEWFKPNRWNIIKCHSDQTNASALSLECWIGEKGSTLTKVLSWTGGVAVEGEAFTWSTSQSPIGHRSVTVPSTVPANNTTGAVLYMYLDDIYIATSEADLPTYGVSSGGGSTISGGVRFTGSVRIQ